MAFLWAIVKDCIKENIIADEVLNFHQHTLLKYFQCKKFWHIPILLV